MASENCPPHCRAPTSGDGERTPLETCDDGNCEGGDGCSAQCSIQGEPRWQLTRDSGKSTVNLVRAVLPQPDGRTLVLAAVGRDAESDSSMNDTSWFELASDGTIETERTFGFPVALEQASMLLSSNIAIVGHRNHRAQVSMWRATGQHVCSFEPFAALPPRIADMATMDDALVTIVYHVLAATHADRQLAPSKPLLTQASPTRVVAAILRQPSAPHNSTKGHLRSTGTSR